MKTYDMYGTTLSIYEAAKSLEQLLHIKFESIESMGSESMGSDSIDFT